MEAFAAVPLSILAGYALGSFPWAYAVARRGGVAIETVDTGNAGAANVFRQVGHLQGALVFLGDTGKGAVAVVLAHLMGAEGSLGLPALAAATAGHWWPVFGRFPGGVGLATVGGGASVLGGWAGLAALVVAVAMTAVLRNAGHGGGVGFAAYVVLGGLLGVEWQTIVGVVALGAAVVLRARIQERGRRAAP